jgi:NAD(P)-dependent dehydrogenase (short-subunit alcohol dehydrogenase family)
MRALITGAARGIGRAIALRLARDAQMRGGVAGLRRSRCTCEHAGVAKPAPPDAAYVTGAELLADGGLAQTLMSSLPMGGWQAQIQGAARSA